MRVSRGALSPPAVTAYVSRVAGLFRVAADAVHGPRVAYGGLPLVGRDMSELDSDAFVYAEARDRRFRYTPEATRDRMTPGS
ncbi:hypothetical protein [Embleya sp. NPDC001921]